ncbi:sporulation protein YqfD [Aquibacillus kalidii]|uniref:sporulation protein YqfD n=1 Tax=Aquibacillus kalidii TaxID=2762597 RepID=UPI001645C4B0|nr:sporulation protein YqfD [Aquibacillus kalidii]
MKQTQGVFFAGYVTIKVSGHHPELFFDLCARKGIMVWSIKKVSKTECTGNIKLKDISDVKALRRKTIYKIAFRNKKGLPFFTNKLLYRKPLIIGLVLSLLFVTYLSNMVWSVNVKGVNSEIQKKIENQLDEYGIQPGALKFNIGSPGEIQQKLLNDIPELLWVGVTEKGTTYHLEGVEKTIVEEGEKLSPRNLVAKKEGVIVEYYISKGQPMIKINDVVKKGDLLVSGELGKSQEEEDKEEDKKGTKKQLVAAEGEIIAKTWYKSNVTIPLETNYEVLTGDNKKKYYLRFGDFMVPVWGFKSPEYKEIQLEASDRSVNFFKWELPISFVKQTIHEKEKVKEKRTKDEAKAAAIKQAKKELQQKLGKDAEITFGKVLQESMESGKVKLTLSFDVLEDIAKSQPIVQGD